MKKSNKVIYFLSITFFLMILFSNFVKATDISYTFNDNVLIDSSISSFDDSFNLRNSSYYTEHYNATYSFENDVNGSVPTGWSLVDESGGHIRVIDSKVNHSNVMEIYDNSSTQRVEITNVYPTNVLNGTIEFWWSFEATETLNHYLRLVLQESATTIVDIWFNYYFGQLGGIRNRINGGSFQDILITSHPINTWNHIQIDLYNNSGTFEFFWNRISMGIFDYYANTTNGIDRTSFISRGANAGGSYTHWIDAIGYSWEIEYTLNYTYNFNELTANTEFSTTGIYANWSYGKPANTDIYVRDSTPFDQEFLRFRDNSATGFPSLRIPFTASINNSFSWYFRFSDVTKDYSFFIQDGLNDRIWIYVNSSDLYTYEGATPVLLQSVSNNVWYNITVSFNCITDTCIILIDSVLIGTFDFYDNSVTLNYLEFRTALFDTGNYTLDFDSISNLLLFTFPYTQGLNLLPYVNSTIYQEVDRFEFALKDINTNNVIGESTYGSWSESDVGGHDTVKIVSHPNNTNNRMVEIDTYNAGDTKGLFKNDFGITSGFINITFGFDIEIMAGTSSYNLMSIESSDFNTHSGIVVYHNGSLNIWSGTIAGSGQNVRNGTTTGVYYEGNFLIDYQLERTILIWYADSVYQATYELPFVDIFGKSGLAEVRFTSHWSDSESRFNVDYCGVYVNGSSVSDEYGYSVYNTGQNWNTQNNNLLYLQANGSFDIGLVSGSYSVGNNMTTFRSMRDYYGTETTINGYDSGVYISNATFVFTVENHYFNLTTFKIDGVLLKQGVNEHSLILEHSGVDIDESYFYVDTSNRLQFRHIANDTNLEYIQARFNIVDVNSTDYAISFRSDMENNAYGFMRVNFTTTSNIIQLPYTLTTTRFILSQENIIRDLIVLVSDRDNDVITGLTTGYVYNVQLIDILSIETSVITESLLNMIVPLIIILTPTLIFSKRFGKQVIVPFIILFSLVLTMTGSIPAWLFFVIVFPSLIIIFFKSREED